MGSSPTQGTHFACFALAHITYASAYESIIELNSPHKMQLTISVWKPWCCTTSNQSQQISPAQHLSMCNTPHCVIVCAFWATLGEVKCVDLFVTNSSMLSQRLDIVNPHSRVHGNSETSYTNTTQECLRCSLSQETHLTEILIESYVLNAVRPGGWHTKKHEPQLVENAESAHTAGLWTPCYTILASGSEPTYIVVRFERNFRYH